VMDRLGNGSFQVGFSIASPTTWKRFGSNSSLLEVTYTPCPVSVNASSPTYPNGFHIGCQGDSNGSITTSVTGGSSYTYSWSGSLEFPGLSPNLTDRAAGIYYLWVYDDSAFCADTFSIELTGPPELVISGTLSTFPGGTNVSCNGTHDGSITLGVTGSTGYNY